MVNNVDVLLMLMEKQQSMVTSEIEDGQQDTDNFWRMVSNLAMAISYYADANVIERG